MKLIHSFALLASVTMVGAGTALAQAAAPAPTQAPAAARPASRTPHPTAGKTDCLSCHGLAGTEHITRVPAEHQYANTACVRCHRVADSLPTNSKHAMDAIHARCVMCHVAGSPTGANAVPASHATRHSTTCSLCHQQAPPAN